LDTTTLLGKTKYSFIKRKYLSTNANIKKRIDECKNIISIARKNLSEMKSTNKPRSNNVSPLKLEPLTKISTKILCNCGSIRHKNCCLEQKIKRLVPLNADTNLRNKYQGLKIRECKTMDVQILNLNQDDEKGNIEFYKNPSNKKVKFLKSPTAQWGPSQVPKKEIISVFGRDIKLARKEKRQLPKYSRESLERLIMNDIKLYIESERSFVNQYALNMVTSLLLQTDKGAKFRKPVAFE